ncbi:MAG TPA: hypothetical protein VL490_01150 [Mucilaginibacter sp.]|nr:hypothetical protein [Mucilaginibacter sp.]
MAKMLAISLIQVNPTIKRAIVTDASEAELNDLFDIIIPYNANFGSGLNQKLHLELYSPFEETLFIDADCLVCKPLQPLLQLCQKHSFVVFGTQINSGEWYMDVSNMCKQFQLSSIPLFNGGTYYFKKNDLTAKIFSKARELKEKYLELGFMPFHDSINEEPLIAVSMAINQVNAVNDWGTGMRTPIGLCGTMQIEVLMGKCNFNKEGEIVSPAIIHFAGSYAQAFHYKREITKLKMWYLLPFLPPKFISLLVNMIKNIPYAIFVFIKRLAKMILRGEKYDFGVVLPVFSNF